MTVEQADLKYVDSVTIDRTLPQAGRLLPGERLEVVDVANGNPLTTYGIEGEPPVKQQDTAAGCRKRRAGADGVPRWPVVAIVAAGIAMVLEPAQTGQVSWRQAASQNIHS